MRLEQRHLQQLVALETRHIRAIFGELAQDRVEAVHARLGKRLLRRMDSRQRAKPEENLRRSTV